MAWALAQQKHLNGPKAREVSVWLAVKSDFLYIFSLIFSKINARNQI
jgi:hypothetical protein